MPQTGYRIERRGGRSAGHQATSHNRPRWRPTDTAGAFKVSESVQVKGNTDAMEWPQIIGICSTALVGIQAVLKVYQRLRFLIKTQGTTAALNPQITIMNGDARRLLNAIDRIETYQDSQALAQAQAAEIQSRQMETLSVRVANVETRLAAMRPSAQHGTT